VAVSPTPGVPGAGGGGWPGPGLGGGREAIGGGGEDVGIDGGKGGEAGVGGGEAGGEGGVGRGGVAGGETISASSVFAKHERQTPQRPLVSLTAAKDTKALPPESSQYIFASDTMPKAVPPGSNRGPPLIPPQADPV
jgi:hypothetical protein